MSVITYTCTYTIKDRVITPVTLSTALLSSFTNQKTIVLISYNAKDIYIDLNRMLLLEQQINYSQTISNFLTSRLTDILVERYKVTNFPIRDPDTDQYLKRINSYSAMEASDLLISYTSYTSTDVRNDPYQRATLNDLVFTSKSRDFNNSLVSVNGVFHTTLVYNKELYVIDGFANLKNNEPKKLIAVHDTTTLGGHTTYPITLDLVTNTSQQNPTQGVYLSFPNANFIGKTLLLVVGGYLYPLDGSYQIIDQNKLKININKMDLINQWLHNPTTQYYLKFGDLSANIAQFGNASLADISGIKIPSAHEQIVFFLQNIYNNLSNVPEYEVMLNQYSYTDLYSYVEKIMSMMNYSDLTSPAFIYKILCSPSSFVIALNNPDVYIKRYPLAPAINPSQYTANEADMPRGMLIHNHHKVLPYVIRSSNDSIDSTTIPYVHQKGLRQHMVSIDFVEPYLDLYKSAPTPTTIVSPWFDKKTLEQRHHVELLELYSA